MNKSAVISECGRYRYELRRQWANCGIQLAVIMLNPSTADAEHDDQTIRKLIEFAKREAYGGIVVTNLYAWRATDPRDLWRYHEGGIGAGIIGPLNDNYIDAALEECGVVLCAWGSQAARDQHRMVSVLRKLDKLEREGLRVLALKRNANGTPAHPLMLPFSLRMQPWKAGEAL